MCGPHWRSCAIHTAVRVLGKVTLTATALVSPRSTSRMVRVSGSRRSTRSSPRNGTQDTDLVQGCQPSLSEEFMSSGPGDPGEIVIDAGEIFKTQ